MFKKYILVFLVSMIPLIELRGAVPIGLSNLWGDPISILPLYLICIIGNMLPVPFIFFFGFLVLLNVHFISSISSSVAEIGVSLTITERP